MIHVSDFGMLPSQWYFPISGKLRRRIRGGGLPAMLGVLWQRCFEPGAVFEWPS